MSDDKRQPKKNGRPSGFSEELGDLICERISNGESLNAICKEDAMPSLSMVMRWVAQFESFRENYAKAQITRGEKKFEELCDLADEPPEKKSDGSVDAGWVNWQRLRVDTRKWAISKLVPRKYGDRVFSEVTGKDGGPIETKDISDNDKARLFLFALSKAAQQIKD